MNAAPGYAFEACRHVSSQKSGWPDSNRRSPAPKAGGLPGFPTSRDSHSKARRNSRNTVGLKSSESQWAGWRSNPRPRFFRPPLVRLSYRPIQTTRPGVFLTPGLFTSQRGDRRAGVNSDEKRARADSTNDRRIASYSEYRISIADTRRSSQDSNPLYFSVRGAWYERFAPLGTPLIPTQTHHPPTMFALSRKFFRFRSRPTPRSGTDRAVVPLRQKTPMAANATPRSRILEGSGTDAA